VHNAGAGGGEVPSMSERDTITKAEDRERIRNHVRAVLSRLAQHLKEQKAKENGPTRRADPPKK
jgi:hypothetical protein